MIKTMAMEWPTVTCRVVDLDSEALDTNLATQLLREMACRDSEVEVGYRGSRRVALGIKAASLEGKDPVLEIEPDWVILITGGARGITAEAARELAGRHRPVLLLAGRSPLTDGEESSETAGLTSPRELKQALMNRMRAEGRDFTVGELEAAYRELCRTREMKQNISAMEEAGARVHYFQVDVRDEKAFQDLIDRIYGEFGRLDVVINGAGIIEDKLLDDKTPDSFDRVFDTKADSAFLLGKMLRHKSLKALVFYSSIAGRFGNPGQCDYAAANEVLNKLALHLDRQWPLRVVSANWGPWEQAAGMVSKEVQEQFASRGVQLIAAKAGRGSMMDELRFGGKGEVEVVLGNGPWAALSKTPPLMYEAHLKRQETGSIHIERTLDPASDLYLQDHVLDGKPVLPAAMAIEYMAEAAESTWPDSRFISIRSLRVLHGIVLDNSSKKILIETSPRTEPGNGSSILDVAVNIFDMDMPGRPSFSAIVQLGKMIPPPPTFDHEALFTGYPPSPVTMEEAYRAWLFHGPLMRGITKLEGLKENAISAILKASSPTDCITLKNPDQWLADPVVVDSAFQLVLIWERHHHGMTGLPSVIPSYHKYGPFPEGPFRCCIKAEAKNNGQHVIASIYFLDFANRLVAKMERAEFTASKALNRLAEFNRSE